MESLVSDTLLPGTVEAIDRGWLDSVLDEPVLAARTLKVLHGTATKIRIEMELGQADGGSRTKTVWVKTGLEPHSNTTGHDKVYAGETFFYRTLGGQYETRTPQCLFADSDSQGNSVIILDDLLDIGATFADPLVPTTPDVVASALEGMARYQAASWMSPDLHAIDFLRTGGCYGPADVLGWLWDPTHWEDYSKRPRFQVLPQALRNRKLVRDAHAILKDKWWTAEPWALCHGDAHYGQMYALPSGEVRLLDWQCVQIANWAHDVSNLLIGSLSIADRRATDRDLIRHYVKSLRAFGVDAPSEDAAYQAYRTFAPHGLSWAMCMAELQPEEVCTAMLERTAAAVMDLGSIELALAGPPPGTKYIDRR